MPDQGTEPTVARLRVHCTGADKRCANLIGHRSVLRASRIVDNPVGVFTTGLVRGLTQIEQSQAGGVDRVCRASTAIEPGEVVQLLVFDIARFCEVQYL